MSAIHITEAIDRTQIENFLYKESLLLDTRKFDEWLSLFTQDACYWMPCNDNDIDPNQHVSYIYDERQQMEERVWRLQSGLAYGQEPYSKTCHLISNVLVNEQRQDFIEVYANFMIQELRAGIQTTFAGRYKYHLKPEDDVWKIFLKKVELLNNNEPLGNISFLF